MRHVQRRIILRFALHVLAGMMIAMTAGAQEGTIRIGVGGAWHTTPGEASFGYPDSLLGPCLRSSVDERGSIRGFSGHIGITLAPFAGIEELGLTARLRWESREGTSCSDPQDVLGMVDGVDYPITYTIQQMHGFTMQSATLDILAEYHLPWSLLVRSGGSIGYRMFGSISSVEDMLAPENVRPLNPGNIPSTPHGRRLLCYRNESWKDGSGLSLGLLAQTGISIPITSTVTLIPEAGVRWEMLPPVKGYAWPALDMNVGMSAVYAL